MEIRKSDILDALGVDYDGRDGFSALPASLASLEELLFEAADALDDDDKLSYAVGDACNIVQVLRRAVTKQPQNESGGE